MNKKGIIRKVRKNARGQTVYFSQSEGYIIKAGELRPLPGEATRRTLGGYNGAGFSVSIETYLDKIANRELVDFSPAANALGIDHKALPAFLQAAGFGY